MDTLSVVIAVIVVGFLIWAVVRLQRRSTNPPKLQVAMELISHINDDLKILTKKKADPRSAKKFKTGHWSSLQEHLDFLELDTVEALKNAFKQMEDYNIGIDTSLKTAAPPAAFSPESLVGPLIRGRAGLARWVQDNIGKETTRGIFSWR
jgi:hypothetical protein